MFTRMLVSLVLIVSLLGCSSAKPQPKQPAPNVNLFVQAMNVEQERQRQQTAAFAAKSEKSFTCQRCGGAGKYRFVDGGGQLQCYDCPGCNGRGQL